MVVHFKRKLRLRKARTPLLFAALAGATASGAIAQVSSPTAPLSFRTDYLGYAASVSPRVTYTDNIDLQPDQFAEDAFIFSNLLTASAIFSNQRFTGIISGDLDLSYVTDIDDFRVNQDIGGASTFTAVENLLYVDIAGQTARQLVGDAARFSANPNAARGQQANINSYSVSPYLYREYADQSTTELRYRFSQVFIDDATADVNLGFGDLLNDSTTHEVLAAYSSGALLDRLRFTLSAYGNDTTEDGSTVVPRFEYQQGSLTGEIEYALTSNFALTGAIGYDDIDTEATQTFIVGGAPVDVIVPLFDDSELSGVFWRAGFSAQPGRRTQIRLEYGRRYDDDFVDASLTYRISPRYTLNASAGRSFETRAQAISGRFRDIARQTLDFADRLREGEELSPRGLIAAANQVGGGRVDAQTVGIGASNNAAISLNGAFDRSVVSLSASYEDTDFGFRQNENIGVNANISRELSRRVNAYAGAFYRRTDTTVDSATCIGSPFLFGFDAAPNSVDAETSCDAFIAANGVTNTVGGRAGLSYRLYENLSVFGEYAHTERFSPSPLLEYSENTVTAGFVLDF
ncbi:MAG: hypothetical protein AAGJ87_00040 [Pseudomonadota bacterium]